MPIQEKRAHDYAYNTLKMATHQLLTIRLPSKSLKKMEPSSYLRGKPGINGFMVSKMGKEHVFP